MVTLSLRGVCKTYGATVAVYPTDLDVQQGEFVTLLGPSGCGKSTLLRIISGITTASGGEITLGGKRIDHLAPEHRDVAMVFQSYALFPHMSVRKNLGFGLRMKKIDASEQKHRIDHAVEICGLQGLLDRMPRQLSGGQQQRVALARAIVMQPMLLLFDEPLSNLDAKLRESLRDELVKLHRTIGTTSVYVTHDQAEAMAMSDRIVVMNAGRVVESGRPVDLYRQPQHEFTAKFLGQSNVLTVVVQGDIALLPWGDRAPIEGVQGSGPYQVSVRPEDVRISAGSPGNGVVCAVSFVGAQVNYLVRVIDQELRVSTSGHRDVLALGQPVTLHIDRLYAMGSGISGGKAGAGA